MHHSFIVPEGSYKAKTASPLFFILKKTDLQAGSAIIYSTGGVVLFASNKAPQVCIFPGKIITIPYQSSLMSCRLEKLLFVSCKMKRVVILCFTVVNY